MYSNNIIIVISCCNNISPSADYYRKQNNFLALKIFLLFRDTVILNKIAQKSY